MGADVTIAQGITHIEPDTYGFAFTGDSTFFASGMTGVVNAVYNRSDIILIVLDNATTAMTGHQPHPGTGATMMGKVHTPVSIEKILRAIGVDFVKQVDPLDLQTAIDTVKAAMNETGVRAVIFKSPCIFKTKITRRWKIDPELCICCHQCIKKLGCPAITVEDGNVVIEPSLCTGCGLCSQVCPTNAIVEVSGDDE